MAIGERLFLNNCAQCHGSDARGSKGFPNLTDNDWLYGGTPEKIETTITNGRNGMMPPMAAARRRADDVEERRQLRAEPVRPTARPDRAPQLGKAQVRRLRRLPRRRRQGQPGARRAQPDRQDLAARRQRGRPSSRPSHKGRNNTMPAHKDILADAQDPRAGGLRLGPVATARAVRSRD